MLIGELRSFWRAEPRDHRAALVVIAIVGVVLRLLTLSQPMRYDEAVTYLEFARYPLSQALSRYDYPNNHVFHTLLVKGAIAVFGNAPWALRVPAFLSGVAIIPLSYAVARTLFSARAALVATALVASSGMLSLYATNARGYSLVVLAFLVLVLIAAKLIRGPQPKLWAVFAVVSALGVWTIPVMLYPLGAVSLWLALNLLVDGRRRDLWLLAGTLAGGAVLSLVAYAPVISTSGLDALVRNKFVLASEWPQFLSDMARSGWSTIKSWGLGLPPIVSSVVLASAVIGLDRQSRLSAFRVGLPLAAFVWSAWLLVATHRAAHPRIWLWCIPILFAFAGAGLVDVLDRYKRLARVAGRVPLLASLVAIGAAASVSLSGAVLRNRDTGTFVDAEATAAQLSRLLKAGDRVIAVIPTNGPLSYYLNRLGVDSLYMRLDEADAQRLIVVVNEGEGESTDDLVQSTVGDTTQFISSVIATRPLSKVLVFERRNAP